jgi:hypothetical protein
MAVAQSRILTAGKGAQLIEAQTGRRCSRQNLEKLCDRGALQGSPCITQAKPLRVDGELLVSEYLARVAPHQAEAQQPTAKRERPAIPPPAPSAPRRETEEPPDYNISRARSEYEKANLLELERKTKEALLIPRDQVEKVWADAVAIARTKLLAIPTRTRQRIPHLNLEEVSIVEDLIRETLEDLSSGE